MPGPVPKRSDRRTRRNKENAAGLSVKRGVAVGVVEWYPPDEGWVEPVRRMYESFRQSGMAAFFEQSDLSLIWVACEGLQAWYDGGKKSAAQFDFVTGLLRQLGANEGERRRMQIELENQLEEVTEEDSAVASIAAYKSRRGVG